MDKKRTNRSGRKRWLLLIDAVLLVALLFALWQLVATIVDYRRAAKKYDAIAEQAVQTAAPQPTAAAASETPQPTEKPSEVPIQVDFETLRQENREAVAWLYAADTPINYPVVQTDDNSYYLSHGFDREKDAGGALFFDYRNHIDAPDQNLILYGHRMKDDSMFGSLPEYAEASYREAHPVMYLITEQQSYRVEVFACRTVRADNLQYFETAFDGNEAYAAYLTKAMGQSYWQAPFGADTAYATLTLVTCSTYAHEDDPRLLVHGRLIPVD